MKHKILFALSALVAGIALAQAQTQAPVVVVQAANSTPGAQPAAPAAAAGTGTDSTQSALKALQQLKAANDDLLKRQAATLQQLEDAEKAAEQMKIYSKRG